MKEKKYKSKEKLITALLCAAAAVAYGILSVMDIISQDGIHSLIHIGLVLVFGALSVESYMKYRKDKKNDSEI